MHTYQREPLPGMSDLQRAGLIIKANSVKKSAQGYMQSRSGDTVIAMQAWSHDAYFFLHFPDAFTGTALKTQNLEIIPVTLGMIACDKVK